MTRTVIVTGGTSAIGAGASRVLAAAGWHVIAASVSQADNEAFTSDLTIETRLLDVTDDASVEALFCSLDRLDGLVNCAGMLRRGEEYDLTIFAHVIAVNLIGTMRCCLEAHPLLRRSGRAIVNRASMLSTFGGPMVPAYAASKGGVAQLTKSLVVKWAADCVRVNALAPGRIETGMTQGLRDAPERAASILARTPMNRWGQAHEVGALIAWLLSPAASFLTGSIYPVDGGYQSV